MSTPSVVLTGYPPGRVSPVLTWWGVPYMGTPLAGYPPAGYPHPDLVGGTLHGYPPAGYPHRVPPSVCPMAFWEMLQSIMGYGYPPVSAPWHSGKCCKALWDMGTPPVDRQIDGWKERCMSKHYLPIVLHTRVVNIRVFPILVWI